MNPMSSQEDSNTPASANRETIPAVSGEPPTGDACCKVDRVAVAYGLGGIDTELRRRRTENDATLHSLTEYLNTRLTSAALSAGRVDIDTDPSTVRAILSGNTNLDVKRQDMLRENLAGGLDIDRLTTDFVSHETVRKHLNNHLDVDTSRGGFDTADDFHDALKTYHDQYVNAIESALNRGSPDGFLSGENFRVYQTRVECGDCSRTYRLKELIECGGCTCAEES